MGIYDDSTNSTFSNKWKTLVSRPFCLYCFQSQERLKKYRVRMRVKIKERLGEKQNKQNEKTHHIWFDPEF